MDLIREFQTSSSASKSDEDGSTSRVMQLGTEMQAVRGVVQKMAEMCSQLLQHIDSSESSDGTSIIHIGERVLELY